MTYQLIHDLFLLVNDFVFPQVNTGLRSISFCRQYSAAFSLLQRTTWTFQVPAEYAQLVSWQKVIRASALITSYSLKPWFSLTAGNTLTVYGSTRFFIVREQRAHRERERKKERVITGGEEAAQYYPGILFVNTEHCLLKTGRTSRCFN